MVEAFEVVFSDSGTWLATVVIVTFAGAISWAIRKLRPNSKILPGAILSGLTPTVLFIFSVLLFSQRSDLYEVKFWLSADKLIVFSWFATAGLAAAWGVAWKFRPVAVDQFDEVFE